MRRNTEARTGPIAALTLLPLLAGSLAAAPQDDGSSATKSQRPAEREAPENAGEAEEQPEAKVQEAEKPAPQKPEREKIGLPRLIQPDAQGANDPRRRMIELFGSVERRLTEIDDLLYGAGAGESTLTAQEESGIGRLLEGSMSRGQQVLEDIDQILELARQQGGSCNSAMQSDSSSQANSQGDSPLDRQSEQRPGERERTPERPDSPQGQQRPEQEQPEDQNGEPQQKQPDSPGEDPDEDPRNNSAAPPNARATGAGTDPEGLDRWGELPPHVREIFRTEGGGDMPPQYREWIESYYRRLNRTRGR